MKKILLTLTAATLAMGAFAQTADVNALLKKTGDAAKATNYKEALGYVNQIKTELNRLIGEQYLAALPLKANDWLAIDAKEPAAGVSATGRPGMPTTSQSYSRTYTKSGKVGSATPTAPSADGAPARQPAVGGMEATIKATINLNPQAVAHILTVHNPTEENTTPMVDGSPVKIKGYKALQGYMGTQKMGTISILVGSAVLEIRGVGIDSIDELTKFIDTVDLAKIKSLSEQ